MMDVAAKPALTGAGHPQEALPCPAPSPRASSRPPPCQAAFTGSRRRGQQQGRVRMGMEHGFWGPPLTPLKQAPCAALADSFIADNLPRVITDGAFISACGERANNPPSVRPWG